jgi:hypothetical protein
MTLGGGGLYNPKITQLTHIDAQGFAVPLGVAGWIDSDVSAITGTDINKVWIVVCRNTGASSAAGCRRHGDTKSPQTLAWVTTTFLSCVDSSGHMDLYRDASVNNTYDFLGYLL